MLQNEWKWSKADEKSLAQFVNEKAFELLLKLPVNRFDLINTPQDRKELIKTIYETLLSLKIHYAHEKYQPEKETQLIRTPSAILSQPGEGTCLDLALLFCSICFGCDLLPLVIVIEGHALAAVSLNYKRQNDEWNKAFEAERNLFNNNELFAGEEKREKLLGLINDGDYIAIECTGFAHSKTLSDLEQPEAKKREKDGSLQFDRAIDVGRQQLSNPKRPFKFAIDIAAAQYLWKIPPLEFPSLSSEATQLITAVAEQKFGTLKDGKVIGIDARGLEGGGNLKSKQDTDTMEGGEMTGIKLGSL
ncbi:hypothetical protein CDG76_28365 [Nostoc sp. 'Peltigera membranacea cyanobiont' 210A]|uniref:hypothetical protein n=1 Tax=Nostoc sp. 'Peltigera membranacea cyanobiont' 210A TaxID=2014529 RepID=UPI000B9510AC|nr:hypothetical protein [Nostoc sp. 'Peltigera membranacea cyanobiont' 210A]OYD91166.1 hypothetical protein CDG76_28365 [Nostoc sp. 'Peltigera membranacea cyanobiont' 210A]